MLKLLLSSWSDLLLQVQVQLQQGACPSQEGCHSVRKAPFLGLCTRMFALPMPGEQLSVLKFPLSKDLGVHSLRNLCKQAKANACQIEVARVLRILMRTTRRMIEIVQNSNVRLVPSLEKHFLDLALEVFCQPRVHYKIGLKRLDLNRWMLVANLGQSLRPIPAYQPSAFLLGCQVRRSTLVDIQFDPVL